MGKTTFAMNVATNNALAGKNVLVFSLEMTNEQLLKKIIWIKIKPRSVLMRCR